MLGTLLRPFGACNAEATAATPDLEGAGIYPKQKILDALIAALESGSSFAAVAAAKSSDDTSSSTSIVSNSSSISSCHDIEVGKTHPQSLPEQLGCAVLMTVLVAAPPHSPVLGMEQLECVDLVESYLVVTAELLPAVLQVRSLL
jgi:hypothetical protein